MNTQINNTPVITDIELSAEEIRFLAERVRTAESYRGRVSKVTVLRGFPCGTGTYVTNIRGCEVHIHFTYLRF